MARTDNLRNFLADIAAAIKLKKGDNTAIPAAEFDTEIANLPSGGDDETLKAIIDRSIISVTVPDGVTSIGNHAFNTCSKMESIQLPSSIKSIGENSFKDCSNLILSELPENVTSIGGYAFYGCSKLALKSLPDGIESLGSGCAFMYCYDLEITKLPRSLKNAIGIMSFRDCNKISISEIPIGVTGIGNNAFSNCLGITSLTFKGKIKNFDSTAFKGCTNLTTINVPWAEGEVANAPWGAVNATINYNYAEVTENAG